MNRRHIVGRGLILALTLGAAALIGPGAAIAVPQQAAESKLLYVSANRVMEYDAATDTSTAIQYTEGGIPAYPARALGGSAITWTIQSFTGPTKINVSETFTEPGQATVHTITADPYSFPRLSPDGTRLLYIVEEADPYGGLTNNLHVWQVADGAELFSIPDVDAADWSPDGGKIVFASYPRAWRDEPEHATLYLYDIASAQETKVPAGHFVEYQINTYSPRWSPSGDWIAFQLYDYGNATTSVVLTGPAGTTERVLMTAPQARVGMGMDWVRMPDGTERLFVDSREAGGAPYALAEVPGTHPDPADGRILHASLMWQARADFSDVTPEHQFYRQIRDLASLRIMGGFEDGSFGPSNLVKRAQNAKMIAIALGVHDSLWTGWDSPTFPDVPRPSVQDDEFRYPFDYVEEATAADLVKGDAAGRFKPWAEITRVQLALMIARGAGDRLEPAVPADYEVFADLAGLSQEALDAIALVYHNMIIQGKTAATFAPQAPATRGHAAAMTWRLMELHTLTPRILPKYESESSAGTSSNPAL